MIGLMNVLKQEGAKYNVMVNTVAPVAATRMTGTVPSTGDAAAVVRPAMAPENVSSAVVYMASSECTDSGLIVHAQGGAFYRIALVRTPGIPADDAQKRDVEWVKAHWDQITSLDGAYVMWNLGQSRDDHLKERAAEAQGNG